MEHFPAALTREQSDELLERIEAGVEEKGFGLWALEAVETPRPARGRPAAPGTRCTGFARRVVKRLADLAGGSSQKTPEGVF